MIPSLLVVFALNACPALGSPLVEHACFHAMNGPFGDGLAPQPLPASEVESFSSPAPQINKSHTIFAIKLPAVGSNLFQGTVKFTAPRTGDWSVFTSPFLTPKLLGADNVALPPVFEGPTPQCGLLPGASVFSLKASSLYRISFGPTTSELLNVVVENVGDFSAFYYPDLDGDGFGTRVGEINTPCVPPKGFVEEDTDCDDHAMESFPRAPELCDRHDNDCDGVTDEMCSGEPAPRVTDAGLPTSPFDAGAMDVASVPQAASDAGPDTAGGTGCSVLNGRRPQRGFVPLVLALLFFATRRRFKVLLTRTGRTTLLVTATVFVGSGCGSDESGSTCKPAQEEFITDALVNHTCLHTLNGPFEALVATVATTNQPELRNTHTAYTIELPPTEAGTYLGTVRFRPRSSGVYSISQSLPDIVVMPRKQGDDGPCQLEERKGLGCEKIALSRSFRLERKQDYSVTVGPSLSPSVMVVIEQITLIDEP